MKKLTKIEEANRQQTRERIYNLDQMKKKGLITEEYYNKKIKLMTIYGGMHHPK